MIITIDGPVASGKSSVSQILAKDLEFYYLYTGLLYRGLAYVLKHNYGYTDARMKNPSQEDIDQIARRDSFDYRYTDNGARIFFDQIDITDYLKSPDVDRWSSMISAFPFVREAVLERQIKIGKTYDIVADGRDTGTIVFPNADYKFFLTASQEVRAKRWQHDQEMRGNSYSFEQALHAIVSRDKRDKEREHSPLVQAEDAIFIDNSDLNIDETIQKIRSYITKI